MISTHKVPFLAVASVLITLGCGDQQNSSPVSGSPTITRNEASALDALRKAAEGGDTKAQFDLATRFDTGAGGDGSLEKAFEWFLKSAEGGNVAAAVEVAKRLEEGAGVQRDTDKSKPWWKKAAEAGNAEAQYHHARTFGSTGRGGSYIWGEPSDLQENAKRYMDWLNKSAAQGYGPAQHALGMTYFLGATELFGKKDTKLIQPDVEKGLPIIQQAADAGYWESLWAMATLYQVGFGKIKIDKETSDKYWGKFVEQTDPEIQRRIGLLYDESDRSRYTDGKNKYQGKALSFQETNKVAFEWFQKSAEKDDVFSIYYLGTMYRDGRGVWKNEQKAYEYLKHAAEKGNYAAMREMAFSLLEGKGVAKDYVEAHKWLVKAADQDGPDKWSDVHKVRNAIGALYEFGWGVDKDIVLAYAWYNVAAGGGFEKAKQNLIRVEKAIKPEELREAQTLSREWKPGKPMVRAEVPQSGMSGASGIPGVSGTSNKNLKLATVGTGFFVSQNGNILTNHHVVEGCAEIRVPAENTIGKLVVADQTNDLALVKLEVTGRTIVQFPDSDDVKQGEEIFVFGYPLDGYLPSAGNITPGIISALAGPGNNSSLVQMTAPVQPGNSGGPLLNKKGKVVGVVVGKANAIKIAKVTGDIPQNVNFAIAPRTVKAFLDGNRVQYQKKGDTFSFEKGSVAIADEARKSSVKIECWR